MAALMEVDGTTWQGGCGLGRVFEEVLMMKMTPAHLQTVTPARETESWSKADRPFQSLVNMVQCPAEKLLGPDIYNPSKHSWSQTKPPHIILRNTTHAWPEEPGHQIF